MLEHSSDLQTSQESARQNSVSSAIDRSYNNYKIEELNLGDDFRQTLFLDGSDKYINQDSKKFWKILKIFIELQKDLSPPCDLSYIIFPYDQDHILQDILNNNPISFYFGHCIFNESIDLSRIKIINTISFENTIFKKDVNFEYTSFYADSFFSNISFENHTYFTNSTFRGTINFQNSECEGIFDFSDVSFYSLRLDKSHFPYASYLRLDGWDDSKHEDMELSARHFQTKETVRIIKAHFEKINNITESNIYYPIEMDKYREEIVNNKTPLKAFFTNQNYFVTTLSKYISQFGTNWARPLFLLFILSYLFMYIYIKLDGYLITSKDIHIKHFTETTHIQYIWTMLVSWGLLYLSTFFKSNKLIFYSLISIGVIIGIFGITTYDNVLAIQNYIIQLTNPINAFKNMNLYEGIEIYGAFVRIIVVTIIYQFLVAFRQNTRRK